MSIDPPRVPTLRAWLQLIRVQNLPTALADVWAGAAIGLVIRFTPDLFLGTRFESDPWVIDRLFAASLGSLFVYGSGMALNDYADRNRDAVLWPARPIPSGAISATTARIFGFSLLGIGAILIICGGASLVVAGLLTAAVLSYDFGLKSKPLPGAIVLGCARGMNWLLGLHAVYPGNPVGHKFDLSVVPYAAEGRGPAPDWGSVILHDAPIPTLVWCVPLAMALHAVALTLLSTQEEDGRQRRWLVVNSILLWLIPLSLWEINCYATTHMASHPASGQLGPATHAAWANNNRIALLLAVSLTVWYSVRIAAAVRAPGPERVRSLVLAGVRAFPVLNAQSVFAWGQGDVAGWILLLLLFSTLLGRRFSGS